MFEEKEKKIIDFLLSFFSSRPFSGLQKNSQIRNIAKTLARHNYKFYDLPSKEFLPAFADLFYGTYRIISPAQKIFTRTSSPLFWQKAAVIAVMDTQTLETEEFLTENTINDLALTMPLDKLIEQTKNTIEGYVAAFSQEKRRKIDTLYTKMMVFSRFCMFDYYALLCKFSSTILEHDFSKTPSFVSVRQVLVFEQFFEWNDLLLKVMSFKEWDDVFDAIKIAIPSSRVQITAWKKLMAYYNELSKNNILQMLIILVTGDVEYEHFFELENELFIDERISAVVAEANKTMSVLLAAKKNMRVSVLRGKVFEQMEILTLVNYNKECEQVLLENMLGDYRYHEPLEYMYTFVRGYINTMVKTFCDLMTIRGQWFDPALSQELTERIFSICALSGKIHEFDESLDSKKEYGGRLSRLTNRKTFDRSSRQNAALIITDINHNAFRMLSAGVEDISAVAKTVKILLIDMERPAHELISNWQEIRNFAEHPLHETGRDIYKKTYFFISLIKTLFV